MNKNSWLIIGGLSYLIFWTISITIALYYLDDPETIYQEYFWPGAIVWGLNCIMAIGVADQNWESNE